jgi:Tfp pilus assembly protein PilZ
MGVRKEGQCRSKCDVYCTFTPYKNPGGFKGTMEDRASNSELISRIKRLNLLRIEKRRYARKACYMDVNYVVRGHSYNDVINNLSQGGACVRTQRVFLPGDEISMDSSFLGTRTHIVGRIAWVGPRSMGIKFRSVTADVKGLRYGFGLREDGEVSAEEESWAVGKLRKRTVRWEPSAGAAKYRLYWSTQGPVVHESDFVEIENKTLVVLPDEVFSFPRIAGEIELGITAVSAVGNESDVTRVRAYFDFTVPEAPKGLTVED